MGLYELVKDAVGLIRWCGETRKKNRKKEIKDRLLRHFEDGQKHSSGSFSPDMNYFLKFKLFDVEHLDIAKEALAELIRDGFVEYQGGRYYLKGHAPKYDKE